MRSCCQGHFDHRLIFLSGRVDHSLISLTDDEFFGVSTTYMFDGLCLMHIGDVRVRWIAIEKLFDQQLLQNTLQYVRNMRVSQEDDFYFEK